MSLQYKVRKVFSQTLFFLTVFYFSFVHCHRHQFLSNSSTLIYCWNDFTAILGDYLFCIVLIFQENEQLIFSCYGLSILDSEIFVTIQIAFVPFKYKKESFMTIARVNVRWSWEMVKRNTFFILSQGGFIYRCAIRFLFTKEIRNKLKKSLRKL